MPAAPRERVRTLRACTACSSRKVKCDGNDTCASCLKLGAACVYVSSGKKRGPPKGAPARGGRKKQVPNGSPDAASTTAEPDEPKVDTSADFASSAWSADPAPSAITPSYSSLLANIPSNIEFDTGDMMSDLLLRSEASLAVSPATSKPANSPHTARTPRVPTLNAYRPTESPSMRSVSCDTGLSEEAIDGLLLIYETFIHPHWPVIYLPALRSLRALETQAPILFDAILAISSANSDLTQSPAPVALGERISRGPLSSLSETILESVRHRILASLYSNRSDLATVQALVIVSLQDLGYGRTSLAYQMGGIASRMAIDLGLHNVGQNVVGGGVSDGRRKQEQCRTLWACFLLDKILAAALQRPPMLRLADLDALRPSVMERDELDLWLSGGAQHFLQPQATLAMECVKSHALSSFNAWCDIGIIVETVLDEIYRPAARRARAEGTHSHQADEATMQIDAQLRHWRTNLPEHLQWRDEDGLAAHVNVGPHVLTLRGWYYTCMLLLHRPRVPYLQETYENDHDLDAIHALQRLQQPDPTSSLSDPFHRLPKGVDASRAAANGICSIMEAYETTFRIRKFPSSWVYLVFQAATVHAGLASHAGRTRGHDMHSLSPLRVESIQRLEQCIRWLDDMSVTWASASSHSNILRNLSAVGAKTRPPSPQPDAAGSFDSGQFLNTGRMLPPPAPDMAGTAGTAAEIIDDWTLFWALMPASDDAGLWHSFNDMFTS
ncbi:hypothetical protein Q8F55_004809 [Vanrija albida]|uniref:Zn(2)-C6 fungal-type domain-containing protein n=1 Tax=Vanrija albida TaxID=181172 RepID=A0ABR3Q073_9TREE